MNTIKSLALGVVLSLSLAISVTAGEMPGPGFVGNPPPPASESAQPTVTDPSQNAHQGGLATSCEATPNGFSEAMIIAIRLLISVW